MATKITKLCSKEDISCLQPPGFTEGISILHICIFDLGPQKNRLIWLICILKMAAKIAEFMFRNALYANISLEDLLSYIFICISAFQTDYCCTQQFFWGASFILIIVIFPNCWFIVILPSCRDYCCGYPVDTWSVTSWWCYMSV